MDYADGKLLARHLLTGEEHLFFLEARGLLFGTSSECDLISTLHEIDPQHIRIMPLGGAIWTRTQKGVDGKIDDADLGALDDDSQTAEFSINVGEYTFERCYKE